MRPVRPAVLSLLLLALGVGPALPQSAIAPAPGSLPPPRAAAPTTTPAAPSAASPAAPTAPRPAAQPPRPTPPQARPPGQASGQQSRPAGQQAQRPGQPPTVGRTPTPANRRPAVAAGAAGAAAGAAGAAAAANRAPEPATPAVPLPTVGSVTGLALPRYAALRSDEVNMRVGPSTSYPIEWTFQRRDLPVQIVGEFQLWRRIRDADGAEGWVHSSTLAGRRMALIRPGGAAEEVVLRRQAADNGVSVARLRPGVIARIRECEGASTWCELQVGGHRGFLRRAEFWGVGPEEEIK